jgi:hypothetical protein
MNDERLQSLYRRMTATRADARPIDADDLVEAMSRSGYPDVEGTPLDRIAASSEQAELLRIALALAPDAQALSRDVAALRAPARRAPARRRWLALAASVGAAAVLFAGLRGEAPRAPDAAEVVITQAPPTDRITSASFETAAQTVDGADASQAPLFSGGFDS